METIRNFLYYVQLGYGIRAAWKLARNTLDR